jgi:hypothetical protein
VPKIFKMKIPKNYLVVQHYQKEQVNKDGHIKQKRMKRQFTRMKINKTKDYVIYYQIYKIII